MADIENSNGSRSWVPVTREHPCPVCRKPDRCKVAPDGRRVLCWRMSGGKPARAGEAWIHDLTQAMPAPPRRRLSDPLPDFPALNATYTARMTPPDQERLAAALRLPIEALAAVALGVDRDGRATFPECDSAGEIIGIVRRAADGSKTAVPGSKRGLTLPAGWRDLPGPLYIVEGPTDALAMTHAKLACVGRPSSTGGAIFLTALLAEWPTDRDIAVVGENDAKGDGRWPGRDGAVRLARHLALALGRPVTWVLPPVGVKDARSYLTAAERGEQPWPERGERFAAELEHSREVVHPNGGPAGRPTILVGPDLGRLNDEASAALAAAGDVYQRNGELVHVIDQRTDSPPSAAVRRWAGTVVIRPLPLALLRDRLSRVADFRKERTTNEGVVLVEVMPPDVCVAGVHAAGQWAAVRRLAGVVTHPVVLADGSILSTAGYHPGMELLVRPAYGLVIAVPDAPTMDDVRAAVAVLRDIVRDFPFQSPEHEAAWLAALLTPLAWHAFDGPAPLFLIDANTRGAGKTLLVDVIALIVTGARLPVMAYTPDEVELRKRITALALDGTGLVTLDNLSGPVGNATLDAALTSTVWRDRKLGVSETVERPLSVVWLATGNNCVLVGDTGRRACHIRVETPDARPELRTGFRYADLRRHVLNERGPLLSAALTILRAWVLAEKPNQKLPQWGSFEGWSDMVRGCVVWAGLPDPGATREALLTTSDRDAIAGVAFASQLARIDPRRAGLYARDIINRAEHDGELRAAVEELTGGRFDANVLGRRLMKFKRRVFGDLFWDRVTETGRGWRWAAFPESEFIRPYPTSGVGGVGGDVSVSAGLPD